MKLNSTSPARGSSLHDAKPAGSGESHSQALASKRPGGLPAQLAPLSGKAAQRGAKPGTTARSATPVRVSSGSARTVSALPGTSQPVTTHPLSAHAGTSQPVPPPAAHFGTGRPVATDPRTPHATMGHAGAPAPVVPSPTSSTTPAHSGGAAAKPASLTGYVPAAGEATGAVLGTAAALAPASSAGLNAASGLAWAGAGAASFVTDHDNRPVSVASKISNTAAGVADTVGALSKQSSASYLSGGLWGTSALMNAGAAGYDMIKGNGSTAVNALKGTSGLLNTAAAGLSTASTALSGVPHAAMATSLGSNLSWLAGAGVQAAAQYVDNRPRPADLEMGMEHGSIEMSEPAGPHRPAPVYSAPTRPAADDESVPPMPGAFPV